MISVLIVDDHELLRAGLRSRLEREPGITVVGEADTAERAVLMARRLQPDLILLDLLLPRKSGYDVIPELADVAPQARILVVSSQAAPSSVRRALSAGAAGYLPKRSSDRELVAAIRLVAGGGGYVEPGSRRKARQSQRLTGTRAPLRARARHLHLLALGYTNQEIAQEALHLRPHGRHASRAHHAQAGARNTRRARDVRARERRHRPERRLAGQVDDHDAVRNDSDDVWMAAASLRAVERDLRHASRAHAGPRQARGRTRPAGAAAPARSAAPERTRLGDPSAARSRRLGRDRALRSTCDAHQAIAEHSDGRAQRIPLGPDRPVADVTARPAGCRREPRRPGADRSPAARDALDDAARRGLGARDLRPDPGDRLFRGGDAGRARRSRRSARRTADVPRRSTPGGAASISR